MNIKTILLTGMTLVAVSSQPALAQGYAPYGGYSNNPYGYQANPNYNYANNYGNQYTNPYGYQAPYGYQTPYYGYRPGNNYGYRPGNKNKSGMDRFFKGNNMPFTGRGDFAEEFWPGRDSIYEDAAPIDGPWNRNWGRAPWNRDYENMWEPEGGPDKWFDPSDPKEGMAWAWEDMMVTPNELGTMPGGWEAPSISVPNPIDVGDEFKNAAGDMPGELRDFSDGFTYGEGQSDNYNSNRGIGFGNSKKKDGIMIKPKTYR